MNHHLCLETIALSFAIFLTFDSPQTCQVKKDFYDYSVIQHPDNDLLPTLPQTNKRTMGRGQCFVAV